MNISSNKNEWMEVEKKRETSFHNYQFSTKVITSIKILKPIFANDFDASIYQQTIFHHF